MKWNHQEWSQVPGDRVGLLEILQIVSNGVGLRMGITEICDLYVVMAAAVPVTAAYTAAVTKTL